MAKNSITDYSKTAASNTDIQSVDIAEGCLPSGINNAIREIMADLADVNDGTVALTSPAFTSVDINGGTIDGAVIGGASAAAGTFTTGQFNTSLNVDGTVTADGLTVSSGATFDGGDTTIDFSLGTGRFTTPNAFVFTIDDDSNSANQAIYFRSNAGQEVATFKENGDISFYEDTGTTAKLFWDASAERLGIGTSSPYRTLTVSGDQTTEGLLEITSATPQLLFSVPSGGLDSRIHNDGSGNFIFGTGTNSATPTERMRINSSGNVGIGTAPPSTYWGTGDNVGLFTPLGHLGSNGNYAVSLYSNGYRNSSGGFTYLGINGNTSTASGIDLEPNANIIFRAGTASGTVLPERMRIDSSGNTQIKSGNQLQIYRGDNTRFMKLYANNSATYIEGDTNTNDPLILRQPNAAGTIRFETGGANERLRIDSSGNVGIGNTSPNTKLDIIGSSTNGSGVVDTLRLRNTGTTINDGPRLQFTAGSSTSGAAIGSQGKALNGADLLFYAGGNSERMRIDSIGNVLLGKTSTAINPMGCMLKPNGQIFSTTNGSDSFHNYDTSQNRYEFYVKGNGGIANYSSNNVNLSDETEKKNITAAASAWDDVKGLSLKEFHYIFEDDADPKQLGVIAQDVQVNHPELIKSFKIDDDTDKLGVVEQQITWMAIKALQEAITKIEDLEARVATLEGN